MKRGHGKFIGSKGIAVAGLLAATSLPILSAEWLASEHVVATQESLISAIAQNTHVAHLAEHVSNLIGFEGQTSIGIFAFAFILPIFVLTGFAGLALGQRYALATSAYCFIALLFIVMKPIESNAEAINIDLTFGVLLLCLAAGEVLASLRNPAVSRVVVTRVVRTSQVCALILAIVVLFQQTFSLASLRAILLMCSAFVMMGAVYSAWLWIKGNPAAGYSSVSWALLSMTFVSMANDGTGWLGMPFDLLLALAAIALALGFAHNGMSHRARWAKTLNASKQVEQMVKLEDGRKQFSSAVEEFLGGLQNKDFEEGVSDLFLAILKRLFPFTAAAVVISHRGKVRIHALFPGGSSLSFCSVLQTREALLESVCLSDRAAVVYSNDLNELHNEKMSLCVVPVAIERNDWAGVVMTRPSSQEFGLRELSFAHDFSQYITEALASAARYNKVRIRAETDALTGLLDRGAVLERATRAFKKARSMRTELSMLFVDIDNFKSINDRFGHSVGDEVLQQVANLCKSCLRSKDMIGRYGGEEFIVILPHTKISHAETIAERIRSVVAKEARDRVDLSQQITLSIGVSCLAKRFVDFEDMLQAADKAMYSAKRKGRNQVVHHLRITPSCQARLSHK